MAKQKQKEPVKEEIQIPPAYSDNVLRHMEVNAKRWEEEGNAGMAEGLREDIEHRRKKLLEFMRENEMEIPEEKTPEPKKQPKAKKKKKREYRGNTNPKLIEQAIDALTPIYEEFSGSIPTSVELFDDYAKVWFEFDEDDAEEGAVVIDWEYFLCVPLYYFWGKKKRDKYMKENKIPRLKGKPKIKQVLSGPTGDFKSIEFEGQNIIVMPVGVDNSRIIRHDNEEKTKFDRSYTIYSGSRYDEDQNTHAYVFNTKEGHDFMWETLVCWYS